MHDVAVRDARGEAARLVGGSADARVLEPSPPSDRDPDWFADDPTTPGGPGAVVTPIPGEGTTWAELGDSRPTIGAFAHDHWLDGQRPLATLPPKFASTRESLHQIAYFVVAPKRFAATGKLGLRYTHRGFGTPFFSSRGVDEQIRVEHHTIVHQHGDELRHEEISSVRRACSFLGIQYSPNWFEQFHDPLTPCDPDALLEVDADAASAIGAWFGFATHVLERARRIDWGTASRVQLWPEHFDPAIELGSAELGQRASYGASPGDDSNPEPYLYVAPWGEIANTDPFWNATSFNGAILHHRNLCGIDDPYGAALDFFATGFRLLTS